jgi:2,4-didehydro-3-deoxy-L-rhamnonate hydrolase
MTTNDVSARDLQIRADRPGLRSDWLNGKSHDNFAPMGPFLVPRAFVPDHKNLFIRLAVNGEVRQNGNTSQFIFTPEEQIEYASNILTLECGDIFSCGAAVGCTAEHLPALRRVTRTPTSTATTRRTPLLAAEQLQR